MDHKAIVDIIARTEQGFYVNSLTYKGIRIWPLIRIYLWNSLNRPGNDHVFQKVKSCVLYHGLKDAYQLSVSISNRYRYHSIFRDTQETIENNSSPNFLFFSRHEEHEYRYNNKFFNPLLDPLIESTKNKYTSTKIEKFTKIGIQKTPRVKKTFFLDPLHELLKNRRSLFQMLKRQKRITGFGELQRFMSDFAKHAVLHEQEFISQAARLDAYSIAYKHILQKIKPKIVFLTCYYYSGAMALIRACKDLGIKTVDIQHGKQGKFQPVYSHWTNVPRRGYELLPDFFWVWGEESKQNIQRWQPQGLKRNIPIVGGNPWLSQWVHSNRYDVACDEISRFFKKLRHYKKIILFTLQPLSEPFPEHLLNAMSRSPDSWIWLVRLHPLQKSNITHVDHLLRTKGVKHFEISNSSQIVLYSLLKRIDYHVTCWSSVCYEALYFNVPTVIIHPNGKLNYSEYIEKSIFKYAETDKQILSFIQTTTSKDMVNEEIPYIETDPQKTNEAIKKILNAQ